MKGLVDQSGCQSLAGQPRPVDVGVALLLAFENILAVKPLEGGLHRVGMVLALADQGCVDGTDIAAAQLPELFQDLHFQVAKGEGGGRLGHVRGTDPTRVI